MSNTGRLAGPTAIGQRQLHDIPPSTGCVMTTSRRLHGSPLRHGGARTRGEPGVHHRVPPTISVLWRPIPCRRKRPIGWPAGWLSSRNPSLARWGRRHFRTAAHEDTTLSVGRRSALLALLALLASVRPRFIPFFPSETIKAVLYADALFKEGERRHWLRRCLCQGAGRGQNNGWGFVLRIGEKVFFAIGRIPVTSVTFLRQLAARRAFIYVWEIVAQLIALSTFARRLLDLWVAWIDNSAGEAALRKGYTAWTCPSTACWPPFGRWRQNAMVPDAVSREDLPTALA